MSVTPPFDFSSREFDSIKQELSEQIQLDGSDYWSDFFESSIGVQFINMIAYLGDQASFMTDQIAREIFLVACKRYATGLQHSKMLGYRPTGPTSATVTVVSTGNSAKSAAGAINLTRGTQILVGDEVFEVPDDMSWPAGTDDLSFTLIQGIEDIEEFTSDGTEFQIFTTDTEEVVDGSWSVFVNEVEWVEAESLIVAGSSNSYTAEYVGESQLRIRFGNGTLGIIPPNTSMIEIRFKTGGSSNGNIPVSAINHSIDCTFGSTPGTLAITNTVRGSGGAEKESLSHIKEYGPQFFKSTNRGITPEDIEVLASSYVSSAYGKIAKAIPRLRNTAWPEVFQEYHDYFDANLPAFNTSAEGISFYEYFEFSVRMANIADVYVWELGSEGVYVNANAGLKSELSDYLNSVSKGMVTCRYHIQDGGTVIVDIDLGTVEISRAYKKDFSEDGEDSVEFKIGTAIDVVFEEIQQPGKSFSISSLYNAIEDVPGVVSGFEIVTPVGNVSTTDIQICSKGTVNFTLEYEAEPISILSNN